MSETGGGMDRRRFSTARVRVLLTSLERH